MKTAYDELSILQTAATSGLKYAGFTLLVNNSGSVRPNYSLTEETECGMGFGTHEVDGGCREHFEHVQARQHMDRSLLCEYVIRHKKSLRIA